MENLKQEKGLNMNTFYRKKPVVIEAFQMTDGRRKDNKDWPDWLHAAWSKAPSEKGSLFLCPGDISLPDWEGGLFIKTLEGCRFVATGDWIIKGVDGELYPCKPDIFKATYEKVDVTGADFT